MTLDELLDACRQETDDMEAPQLWSDAEFKFWLNEAEREACIRARLIEDVSSAATTVSVTTATAIYALHASVLDVLRIEATLNPGVALTRWTLTPDKLVLATVPLVADTLNLTIVRLPLADFTAAASTPEIQAHHHRRLVDWALFRAYSKRDSQTDNPGLAAQHLALFEQSFGYRPPANVQRKWRDKRPHVVKFNPL